jgi:hypothetical protein
MDDRLHAILARTGRVDLHKVATGVLGTGATVIGEPVLSAVYGHISDPRTLGVVKVSGMAETGRGGPEPWSAVAKVVDLAETTNADSQWTRPEIEEIVYEEGYFAGEGRRFRPARCHLVSRLEGSVRVFWLEDQTGAEHAPFGVEQLSEMARHLGDWSGAHRHIPDLKFELPRDVYLTRWALPDLESRYARLRTLDPVVLRKSYRDVSLDVHSELRARLIAQNERTKTHPHGLAFGDCQVGNLFHLSGETVAVDWTTLADDPIGADAGSMIGSTLIRAGLVEVIRNERALFDCYFEGLQASGWKGERDDIRRGYFCQFGHYLVSTVGLMPVAVEHGDWPKAVMERRLEAPLEVIQDMLAQVIATYPEYLAEVAELAER